MRSPSVAKQRRRTERPRCTMRAQGCRCPAISPGGDFVDGSWRKVSAPTASASTVSPGRPAGGRGSWLPDDPEPVASGHHRGKVEPHPVRQARCALAVMKTVAEADHDLRPVVVDDRLEPQQRRGGVVGRHQHAAPRQRRALFQMQVGDAEQAEVREIERAAPVAERGLAGHRDLGGMGRARKEYRFRPSHALPAASLRLSHRLFDQLFRFRQKRVARFAVDPLAADLQHDRHGQRRDAVEILMHDSTLYTRQHVGKSPDIEQAGRRIRPRRLQQDVVGLMRAQARRK